MSLETQSQLNYEPLTEEERETLVKLRVIRRISSDPHLEDMALCLSNNGAFHLTNAQKTSGFVLVGYKGEISAGETRESVYASTQEAYKISRGAEIEEHPLIDNILSFSWKILGAQR